MITDSDLDVYQPQVLKAARYISKRFQVPLEEALQEGNAALFFVLHQGVDWNPDKGGLNQWIRNKVVWHLIELYTRGRVPHQPDLKTTSRDNRECASSHRFTLWEEGMKEQASLKLVAKANWFDEVVTEVSEECSSLLYILRDAPKDLLAEILPARGRSPHTKRANLRRWMIDVADWEPQTVDRVFEEVKACL